MKVFISWSGPVSRSVAHALKDLMETVLQAAKPWLSDQEIESGQDWNGSIMSALGDSRFGILCLTQENKNKPWILFEAGAISKGHDISRVCPLLIDLRAADLEPPLSRFQARAAGERESILRIFEEINRELPESVPVDALRRGFSANWNEFRSTLSQALESSGHQAQRVERKEIDLIAETLEIVRGLAGSAARMDEVLPSLMVPKEEAGQNNDLGTLAIAANSIGRLVENGRDDQEIRGIAKEYCVSSVFIDLQIMKHRRMKELADEEHARRVEEYRQRLARGEEE